MEKVKIAAVLAALALATSPVYAATVQVSSPSPLVLVAADHDHDHAAQGAKGKGVVNSVDVAGHKVNVSHEPIPSLSWPAMKMDFAVAPTVDLKSVKAGTQIEFTVGKNKEGLPEIQAIQPVKK